MNVFIRAIARIFSFGERLIVPINEAIAENILTIALINIHYLYNSSDLHRHNTPSSEI